MQKLIFTDGTEFVAADFTYWADALQTAFTDRTQLWAGTGGVFSGGVVSTVSGLTVAVSGPLKAHANGELIQVTSPANLLLPDASTRYIIATYATTDDTPATYYGAGSPPNKRRHDAATVTASATPAVLASGQIPLATVVTAAGAIFTITDTRVLLPFVDASGNLNMGALKTVDGVDLSVHVTTQGNTTVSAHVTKGSIGGAAVYEAAAGYWIVERYVFARAGTFIPDDTDFSAPPATVDTFRHATPDGHFDFHAYGPEYNIRATLNFTSTATFTVNARIEAFDDSIRVKSNGSLEFSNGVATANANQTVTMHVATGANNWVIYAANGGGNQMITQLLTDILRDGRITFTPL